MLLETYSNIKGLIESLRSSDVSLNIALQKNISISEALNNQIKNYIAGNPSLSNTNLDIAKDNVRIENARVKASAENTLSTKSGLAKSQMDNYQAVNQFKSGSEWGWSLPGGLSKVDFKSYFSWLKLNLNELKNNPYKIGMILGFQIPFYLMNPSWREGQIFNPLNRIANALPLLGGTELIPHALDLIASPGHEQLAQKRDDIKATYEMYSKAGINIVHGVFDSPVRIDAAFPFIHIGMPFADSQKWPTAVSIAQLNNTLNENTDENKYPSYAPITQDDIETGIDYESLYIKKDKLDISTVGGKFVDKWYMPKGMLRKPWAADLEDWEEYEIIDSDDIEQKIDALYLPVIITDLRTQKTAIMKPYIKRINQDFQPNWNIQEYFNRVDSIATYKNTRRNLTLDLMFVAYSPASLTTLKRKTQFLENLVFPMYEKVTLQFVASPICRIRIGDLISVNSEEFKQFHEFSTANITDEDFKQLNLGCPAYITQLTYDYSETYPWNISEKNKTLKVFGMSLTMVLLHDYTRGPESSRELMSKAMETEIRRQVGAISPPIKDVNDDVSGNEILTNEILKGNIG